MPLFYTIIKDLEDHLEINHEASDKLYKHELYTVLSIILGAVLCIVYLNLK